jgi:cytidylate kinase
MEPKPTITRGWAGPDLDARIAAHVRAWEVARRAQQARVSETDPFITISRQFGCEALPLAQQLVRLLNERSRPAIPWAAYDREVLDKVSEELHLRREIVEAVDEHRRNEFNEFFDALLNRKVDETVIFRKVAEVIRALALHGHAVIVGRGGYLLTRDLKTGLHVRLVGPRDWRVKKYAAKHNVPVREAERTVDRRQRERERFLRTFFVPLPADAVPYHLVLDNSHFDVARMAEIVFAALDTSMR